MALLFNRARMTTSTTGTGTITLGSAVSGYQSFADAGVSDADDIRYVIEDGTNWEIGNGTYTASGTTLTRTVLESSNADAAISLSGSAEVYIDAAAEDLVTPDGTETLSNKTFSDAAILEAGAREAAVAMPADDISMANGGVQTRTLTGATTFTESLADGDSVMLHLAAGATYTVTWPTMTWVGGSAPTLTADDVIVIWQRDTTVYGKYIGSVA